MRFIGHESLASCVTRRPITEGTRRQVARGAGRFRSSAPVYASLTPPHMSDVRHLSWDTVPREDLTPLISRQLITSEQMMLADVHLKQGAIVPAHDHINEQFTYILSGALRFWIGVHADAPDDTYVDVRPGEVLVIPSMARQRA